MHRDVSYGINSGSEAELLAGFRKFQDSTRSIRFPLYMFFTSGLGHWAWVASKLASRSGDVVLIGGNLDRAESDWFRSQGLPFHDVKAQVDDKTIWDFLWTTTHRDFGWVDVDCLVTGDALMPKLQQLTAAHAMSGVWQEPPFQSVRDGSLVALPRTHLAVVAWEAIELVNAAVRTGPSTYARRRTKAGRWNAPYAWSEVLGPRHLEALGALWPLGEDGTPREPVGGVLDVYPGGRTGEAPQRSKCVEELRVRPEFSIYDTHVVWQAMCLDLGLTLAFADRVERYGQSAEAVHYGGCANYSSRRGEPIPARDVSMLLDIIFLRQFANVSRLATYRREAEKWRSGSEPYGRVRVDSLLEEAALRTKSRGWPQLQIEAIAGVLE